MLIAAFAVISSTTYTQTQNFQTESTSKIHTFISETGKLLLTDYIALGTIACRDGKVIELEVAIAYEIDKESEGMPGLSVKLNEDKNSEDNASWMLDAEEVNPFLEAVFKIYTLSTSWKLTGREHSEAFVSTKDKVVLGLSQKGFEQKFYVTVGNEQKLKCNLSADEYVTFIQVAGKAKKYFLKK